MAFDERLKDLRVEEVTVFTDQKIQVSGTVLGGKKVWILLDVAQPVKIKFHAFSQHHVAELVLQSEQNTP